jgi:hypothetical protein
MVRRHPLRPILRASIVALLLLVLGVGFAAYEAAAGHTHEAAGPAFYSGDCPTAALGAIAAASLTVESPQATATPAVAPAAIVVAFPILRSVLVSRSESRAPPISLS